MLCAGIQKYMQLLLLIFPITKQNKTKEKEREKNRGTKNFLSVQYIKLLYICYNCCRAQIYTLPTNTTMFSHTDKTLYFKHLYFFNSFLRCRCLQGCRGGRGEQGSAEPSSASAIDLELTQGPLKTVNSVLSVARTTEESPNLQNSHSKKKNRQTNESYGAPTV